MKRIPRSSKSLLSLAVAAATVLPVLSTATGVSADAAVAPSAPTELKAVVTGTKVSLSWVAPASNGGSAITGYSVAVLPGGGSCNTLEATWCTVKNLKPGVEYTAIVRARNAVDLGDGESVDFTSGLLPLSAGTKVRTKKAPAASIAESVEVAVKGRVVTVGAMTPAKVRRYNLSLYTVAGEKAGVNGAWAKPGSVATVTARASAVGRYVVVLTARRTDGTAFSWNGPVVTLK